MENKNFGFSGDIPPNIISIEDNIKKALNYQQNHTHLETLIWFEGMVQGNRCLYNSHHFESFLNLPLLKGVANLLT